MTTGQPNHHNVSLGHALQDIRHAKHMSQQEVVDLSQGELRKGTVIALENATYNVGIRQLAEYAEILGCKIIFQPRAQPTDR